jgi:tripartite-type tricarboxylate transporter receptor subunit TctC
MKGSLRAVLAAMALCVAGAAWGQGVAAGPAYPAKAVRLLIGFPPGSAADVVARIVSPRLGERLGQPVVAENRAGAGSSIAAEAVVRSPADGYTLFLGSVANAINASLNKDITFDFAKELAPVAGVATLPNLLVVHPSLAVHSVQELVAAAKANPGAILYGSSGNGTSPHLSGELFNLMADVKLVHIPYKGSPQAVTDLLAGRVQVMFSPASTVLAHIKAGKLRALASTGAQRTAAAPDLPTVSESGLPGFETSIWFGLFAPAATPREVIDRLARDTAAVISAPDVRRQLATQGVDPLPKTPEQLGEYVRDETDKWGQVVRNSGARID